MYLEMNLGVKDRVFRIVIGLILLSLVIMHIASGWMFPATIYLAGIIIFEATIGY